MKKGAITRRALGTRRRRYLDSLVLVGAAVFVTSTAAAFEYRRPGLDGVYSARHLTNPLNGMSVIAGPGSSHTFGQRYDDRSIEGGIEYGQRGLSGASPTEIEQEAWSRFGVAFGLLPYLDAGAVFLNFKYAPNFDFTEVLVFVTQAYPIGDWEVGVRFSFLTPSEAHGWQFNPGFLAVYRGSSMKLEAGVLSAFAVGSLILQTDPAPDYFGLNAPVRLSYNLTPQLYAGVETGLVVPRFDQAWRTSLPMGGLFGYTLASGGTLFDVTASIKWDEFIYLDAGNSANAAQPQAFRVDVGLNLTKLVSSAPN